MGVTTDRRRRHLIDPADPRPRQSASGYEMSLSTVQMWVMSVLAVSTILHLAAGVFYAAFTLGDRRAGAETGLILIAGIFCVMAVVAGRAIHRKPVLSPWLLLGVAPVVVALLVR
ncbi:hypothetical protein KLP28_08225 [Nocardioidaceae bacterium]|nr:hypothetical protein KLP28_08225 [Nocardioidaceae bacterium]